MAREMLTPEEAEAVVRLHEGRASTYAAQGSVSIHALAEALGTTTADVGVLLDQARETGAHRRGSRFSDRAGVLSFVIALVLVFVLGGALFIARVSFRPQPPMDWTQGQVPPAAPTEPATPDTRVQVDGDRVIITSH